MVFRQGGLSSGWSNRVVFHQGGLSLGWSLIKVVFPQDGLSSRWSFLRMVFHQDGLIRVPGGLSSGWSNQGGPHQGFNSIFTDSHLFPLLAPTSASSTPTLGTRYLHSSLQHPHPTPQGTTQHLQHSASSLTNVATPAHNSSRYLRNTGNTQHLH